ncbi:MAG: DHH family phosphoesterase [Candidatus Woesearchaeota archaeon]
MITENEIAEIKDKLVNSSRPLFLFDDDADGVTSFVMLYKLAGEGKGICVKGKPIVEASYLRKVDEFSPDRVFILDKPMVEQEFLDGISQEVIWLDHHPLQNNKGVKYYNPHRHDAEDNRPTSFWAYKISHDVVPEALWLAGMGVVGDWSLALKDEFCSKFPDLLPCSVKSAPEALFTTKLGLLVKILDFNLKGTTTEVMQSIKVLTRIKSPYEILDQSSPKGKYLYKKFLKINERYEELKNSVEVTDNPIILFKYTDNKLAISSMLSNELLFLYPDKIIMIAREKIDELMISIRSSEINIEQVLSKSLLGVNGYGGGHDNACGACIKRDNFDLFIENFKNNLNDVLEKK